MLPLALSALFVPLFLVLGDSPSLQAADFKTAELLYRSGRYDDAAAAAEEEVRRGIWNEQWSQLLIKCHLTRGRYEEALAVYQQAVSRYSSSLTLRLLGVEAMRANDLNEQARRAWGEIQTLMQRSSSRYASRDTLIAMGRYFAKRGEDARQVLELFFDRVRDADPNFLESYLATAELALDKGDFQVAAQTLERAESVDGSDPRVFYLMAKAFAPSDSERATEALRRALELNPRHVDSLLMQIDHDIDRERYEEAEERITQVLQVNLHEPRAWAYLAVLAHLRGDYELEALMRAAALSSWSENPEVDHLIGKKLSDKYRFAEGSGYQQRALMLDPRHTEARFQLANDLLRLGNDEIGWELATRVADQDPYNVVAHNLATLRDRVSDFRVLQVDDVQVRMEGREAAIYGEEVLKLVGEARRVLFEKYDVEPDLPIKVEIFPEQKDFAIRTFGLPGGAGFLGVCFGHLVTANSPASQGERPANWKSVLWHELCHVVTLGKTKNRMPRWLSEGISVYEERQRDPSWGERMTPRYREMILGPELTPVTQLSGAFLNPPSPLHLQFAYYESSLVVEFLIERHGLDALKEILDRLGEGLPINDALAGTVGSLERLDQQFADYARRRAREYGSELDWSRDERLESPDENSVQGLLRDHPDNAWGLLTSAKLDLVDENFDAAIEKLERLRGAGAAGGEAGGALEKLAEAYRGLGDEGKEREVLEDLVRMASDALPARTRLTELAREREEWEAVERHARGILAINPLIAVGHERLAEAAEKLGRPEVAVAPLEALLSMEPIDPAALHYRLAVAQAESDQRRNARRHVLLALEEAPRYQDALRLLLELNSATAAEEAPGDSETPAEPEGASNSAPGNRPDNDPPVDASEAYLEEIAP